ncbi:diaminopimelate epimerase [Advenella alkanexedens]|jgi:diaminopimelate epimerase|uniref:Diaminopimelate epimerase n=1 Tax=Advenella alkanexedens TaxID=1481665 RepID=A0ABS6NRQ2_9BURK|nr:MULTISPECIES: diaminopimelate epimerase [Advenella]MBV4398320.1 diaminopimelate epimerase [Advenella alkanexedens]MDD3758649.1 diaminopimelate epimerase [Advenella sp.]NLN68027.1 diaminopimelate epimerase [Alcaligenaceae bacterium]NLY35432.1 diaminopimelate epimerase [Alcaligenaceae bacterium]
MIWQFTKMHGAGNDFIVLDGVSQPIEMTPERARALAHRQLGIGADQILLVETPSHPEADFRYRIFNADGSEVEHCGNGSRCFVRFVHEQRLSRRNPLRAEIATGLITLEEKEDNSVTVDMGVTRFDPAALPFDTEGLSHSQEHEETLWNLPLPQGGMVTLSTLAISNPHAVLLVDNIDTAPVATLGPFIESHPRFGNRVNVGFMQVVNRHHIRLRVYERGVGETLSCGTGACAAVATGIRRGLLDSPVTVQTRGGLLTIEWNGTQLKMTGPATTVFSGQIDIDKLVKDFCLKDE